MKARKSIRKAHHVKPDAPHSKSHNFPHALALAKWRRERALLEPWQERPPMPMTRAQQSKIKPPKIGKSKKKRAFWPWPDQYHRG